MSGPVSPVGWAWFIDTTRRDSAYIYALKVLGTFYAWCTPAGEHGWAAWARESDRLRKPGGWVWLGLYPDYQTAARAAEKYHEELR